MNPDVLILIALGGGAALFFVVLDAYLQRRARDRFFRGGRR